MSRVAVIVMGGTVRAGESPHRPPVDDAGGDGGAAQQLAGTGCVRPAGIGRDRGRPHGCPLGPAPGLLGPEHLVPGCPLLAGGRQTGPRSEPIADPPGDVADGVGMRPELAGRLVVKAPQHVGDSPPSVPVGTKHADTPAMCRAAS